MAASSVAPLVAGATGDAVSAPLTSLPTAALILRAWCGLTFWAMSGPQDLGVIAAAESTSAHGHSGLSAGNREGETDEATSRERVAGGDPNRRSSAVDGGEFGGTSLPLEQKVDEGCGPIRVILSWVLPWGTPRTGADDEAGARCSTDCVSGSSAAGADDGVASAQLQAARGRMERVSEWKVVLLLSLVRALSTMKALGKGRADGRGERQETQPLAEELQRWLQTSVSLLVPPTVFPRSATVENSDAHGGEPHAMTTAVPKSRQGGVRRGSECQGVEDAAWALLREWNVRINIPRGRGDESRPSPAKERSNGKSREYAAAQGLPLWMWLVVAGLREQYCCHLAPDKRVAGACHGEQEEAPVGFKKVGNATSEQYGVSTGEGTASSQERNGTSLLREILDLSPKDGPAQVLAALSRGAARPVDDFRRSDGGHHPVQKGEAQSNGEEEQRQRQRDETCARRVRNSCLRVFANVWRVQASRNLSAWGRFRRRNPAGDVTAGHGLRGSGSVVLEAEDIGYQFPSKRPKPGDGTDNSESSPQQPDALLVGDTDDTLRAPLKLALLLSLLPRSPAGSVGEAGGASAKDRSGHGEADIPIDRTRSADKGRTVDGEPPMQPNLGTESSISFHETVDVPWGDADPIGAAFGLESAAVWRKLFATRQGYLVGFAKGVLRRFSKDCARLALSAPQAAEASAAAVCMSEVVTDRGGPATGRLPADQRDASFPGGWGLAFSQTQQTQKNTQGEDGAADTDRGGNKSQKTTGRLSQQNGSTSEECGPELGPAPPSASIPLLAEVTSSLLHASLRETGVVRARAWGAALASLAWLLASKAPPQSCLTSPHRVCRKRSAEEGSGNGDREHAAGRTAASLATASTDAVAVKLSDCVESVHEAVSSAGSAGWLSVEARGIPAEKDFLTPLCRFLASGIQSWSSCTIRGASTATHRGLSPKPACWWLHSTLRQKTRAMILSVFSGVKTFAKESLTSPDVLRALTPLLVATLDMPSSG